MSPSEYALVQREDPRLSTRIRRSFEGRFSSLTAYDSTHLGEADVAFQIDIDDSSQVYRVAQTLSRIDVALRRASAAFVSDPSPNGYYRPLSPVIAGLVFESVDVASYHGRHRLQGQSLGIGQRYPISLAVATLIAGGALSAYVVPLLPGQPRPAAPPTVSPTGRGSDPPSGDVPNPSSQPPEFELDLRIRENSPLSTFRGPPGSLQGGVTASVIIIIESPAGRSEITATLRPQP